MADQPLDGASEGKVRPECFVSVRQQLRVALEENDDGSEPKTHAVVIGELRAGVLAVDSLENEANPRLPVLDTALTLDIETNRRGSTA
ncbi:MAG: hypothetical protein KAZ88_12130 [Acidimicrobiia bacterium]|nr:hypothetical protein [Acidimicrobiia bacterium]MBP8181724.1 hypothetical protein [Acidimicrobiia bacterium]